MSIWVIEYDHGPHSRGVEGVAASLDEAVKRVKDAKKNAVVWAHLDRAMLGGAWILRGTWAAGDYSDPQVCSYYFTEHECVLPEVARIPPSRYTISAFTEGHGEDQYAIHEEDPSSVGEWVKWEDVKHLFAVSPLGK